MAATAAGIVGLGTIALGLGLGFASAGSSAGTGAAASRRRSSRATDDGAAPVDGPTASASAGPGSSGASGGGAVAAFLTAYLSASGLLWAVVNFGRVPSSALISAIEVPG
jgi:hypothetical protein